MARSPQVPHHSPTILVIPPSATHGITRNCVRGHTRNAVSGEAIFSSDCPNQKTLHWRSSGTTFCRMVCSQASAIGQIIIHIKNPIPTNHTEETSGKSIQIVQLTMLIRIRNFTGLLQSPYFATIPPPTIKPTLVIARTIPQSSTDTIERP